jgi:RNA recognition motif-containing protein
MLVARFFFGTTVWEDQVTTKLHIGNLPRTTTTQDIEGLFRPFGLVASVVLTMDSLTGQSTGCGTVEMDNESDALSAISRLNFSQFAGRIIGVSRKRPT